MCGCLILGACTTHYNDRTNVAFPSETVVLGGSPATNYASDIPLSENSRMREQSPHPQYSNDAYVGSEATNKQNEQRQERTVPVTTHQSKDPELINQEYYSAARRGENTAVAARLNEGANANYANAQGETALHIAAASGNYHLANTVLNAGANVNALTSGGWTALHSAARFGHLDIVDLLLQAGIDRYVQNRDGKSALDLAKLMGNSNIVSRLSE